MRAYLVMMALNRADFYAMPLTVGSRIAHYDVTALIGEGSMGQVYQATDTKLATGRTEDPARGVCH